MTVSGDVLYLPMLSPVSLPFREPAQTRRPAQELAEPQHRVYRLPPRDSRDGLAYGPSGFISSEQTNGRVIDLYA